MFKIGDQVAIMSKGEVWAITTLAEQDKKYWIIGDFRYDKESGRAVEGWNITHIELAEQRHFEFLRKKELQEKLSHTEWSKFDLETLATVGSIITDIEQGQAEDIIFELLQLAEQKMFYEKNRNAALELTHKMLQGVLKNYYELRNI